MFVNDKKLITGSDKHSKGKWWKIRNWECKKAMDIMYSSNSRLMKTGKKLNLQMQILAKCSGID